MTPYTAKLASLIASRICHDLISPVGAISNGLELMALGGGGEGPEMTLVTESCENASARIRFFRIAFGAASDNSLVARREVVAVLENLSAVGRITYDWTPGGDLPRREVQLALLALQCVETALPRGGEITLEYQPGLWSVTGQSERISPDLALWTQMDHIALSTGPDTEEATVPPNQVQFLLLPLLARELGRKPVMEQTTGQLVLTV